MNSCLIRAIRWREPQCLWKPGARLPASLSGRPWFQLQHWRRAHPRPPLRAMPGRRVQVSLPALRRGLVRLCPGVVGGAGRHFRRDVAAATGAPPEFRRELLELPARGMEFLLPLYGLEPPARWHPGHRSRRAEEGPVQARSYRLPHSFWGALDDRASTCACQVCNTAT